MRCHRQEPPCRASDDLEIEAPPYAELAQRAAAFDLDLDALDPALRAETGALAPDDRIFPVTSQTVYSNLRRYGRAIGVEGLTVHTLRHTAAKLRRQSGASLEDVQAVLGHASVATTARYLARLEGARDPGWQAAAALLAS